MFVDGLALRKVTIETTFKPYGDSPSGGLSSGTTIGVECDVDPNIPTAEFKRAVYLAKEQLDLMALTAELAKGALSQSRFQFHKDAIKKYYDKILGRVSEPSTAQS